MQQGIARVRAAASEPVIGTAFLIFPRHAMTCAHAVNEARGLPWDATERPAESVWVEFPFAQASSGSGFSARVVEWRPPSGEAASDIAVLELEREACIRPYRTAAAPPERGQRFWTKGFPAGHDGGMDAAGRVGTVLEHGRLFVEGDALPNFFIEGGFSGAPLLDEATSAVLGMAAEAERDRRSASPSSSRPSSSRSLGRRWLGPTRGWTPSRKPMPGSSTAGSATSKNSPPSWRGCPWWRWWAARAAASPRWCAPG